MILLFAIFLVILLFIVAYFIPVVCLMLKQKQPAHISVEEVDLATVEKVDNDFFEDVKSIMEVEGFDIIADLLIYNQTMQLYARLFYNSVEGISLEVVQVFSKGFDKEQLKQGETVLVEEKASVITLDNTFTDGLKLITSTQKMHSPWKYKDRVVHRYYGLGPREVLKRHREHIIENSIGRQIIKNACGDVKETVLKEHNEEIERQIKHGFIKLDSSGQYFYVTIYGAVISLAKTLLHKMKNRVSMKAITQ